MTERFIAFDLEMPGQHEPRISAVGITVIENRKITDKLYYLVNPETQFDPYVVKLIGITPEMVENEPTFPVIWEKIKDVMSSGILVAHGAAGDLNTLCLCLKHYGIEWKDKIQYLCTCDIGLKSFPDLDGYSLDVMCEHIGFNLNHHYALSDSEGCARLLLDYIDSGIDVESFISSFDFQKCHRVRKKKVKRKKTLEQKVRIRLFSERSEEEYLKTLEEIPTLNPKKVIGLSLDTQKQEAQRLLDENKGSEYIKFLPHEFHEENNIHALILNERKRFTVLIELLNEFLPYINNAQTLELLMPKLFEKGQPELISFLKSWLSSDNYYTKLFALGVIDNFYVKTAYSDFLRSCVAPLLQESGALGEKASEIISRLSLLEAEKKIKKRKRSRRKSRSVCAVTDTDDIHSEKTDENIES
ncbi:MAG: exonuclease domain-containing protein [Acutalibacteraceae bacterium]